MEYEIYTFINYAGIVIVGLIILYHFLGKWIKLKINLKLIFFMIKSGVKEPINGVEEEEEKK